MSPLPICQAVERASSGGGDLPQARRSSLPGRRYLANPPVRSYRAMELPNVLASLDKPQSVLRLAQLLEQGLDPDLVLDGRPILHAAIRSCASRPSDVRRRRLDGVLLLLEAGADPNTREALHVAVEVGDMDAVDALLLAGANVDAPGERERTPLDVAVSRNDPVTVNHLLHRGATWTAAMSQRAVRGQRSAVEIAICHGVDPSSLKEHMLPPGDPPSAAEASLLAMFNAVAVTTTPIRAPSASGPGRNPPWTASPIAREVRRAGTARVAELLAAGADPNTLDVDGVPILRRALEPRTGAPELVKLLLDHGADPNLRQAIDDTRDGMPPLGIAAKDDVASVRLLLEAGADPNLADARFLGAPLAEAGSAEIVDVLVAHGADVKHRNLHGWPALQRAAKDGRAPPIRRLLQHGADANLRDFRGGTALLEAAKRGYTATVEALLEGGADPNAAATSGRTALEIARADRHFATASVLAAHGSNPASFELLRSALWKRDVELANQLLDEGVRPPEDQEVFLKHVVSSINTFGGARDGVGARAAKLRRTVDASTLALLTRLIDLGWTVDRGILLSVHVPDPRLVKLLLRHGADPNASERGLTPLHRFARQGGDAAIDLLLAAEADTTAVSETGFTPLHEAANGPRDYRMGDGPPPDWEGETPYYVRTIEALRAAGVDLAAEAKYGGTALDIASRRRAPEMEPVRAALR